MPGYFDDSGEWVEHRRKNIRGGDTTSTASGQDDSETATAVEGPFGPFVLQWHTCHWCMFVAGLVCSVCVGLQTYNLLGVGQFSLQTFKHHLHVVIALKITTTWC